MVFEIVDLFICMDFKNILFLKNSCLEETFLLGFYTEKDIENFIKTKNLKKQPTC